MARHPPAERVLVFIDQLEELFTLAEAGERQRFLTTLCMFRAEERCSLLLALRADFFGAFMDSALWPELAGRISRLEVGPLRGAALAQGIAAPAARVGVHLEARLCDRICADAAGEPGALPHVQEAMRLLWEQRRQRFIGLAEYQALGDGGSGLHLAIAQHADATMRALTVDQQTIARRILLRLVSFGEGRADTRRQQRMQALRSAADDAAEFARVLQQFVDDRLITVDGTEGDDDALVDLSHEALITAWPALRACVARQRADELRRRWFEAQVSEWIERGRGLTRLLDPVELSEAEQWMQSDAARELGYRVEFQEFVTASRNEITRVERQRRRRTFLTIAVLIVALVVVSILGIAAWHERQKEHRLVAAIYIQQGEILLREQHPMKALLYLVAAKSQGFENSWLRTLFARASRDMPLVTFAGHKASIVYVSFSEDGKRVVTASYDKTARVWDGATGQQIAPPLEHQGGVRSAVFSADGMRIVTASDDQTARVWDAWTGKPVTSPLEHRGAVTTAVFSSDGTRVVTGSSDGIARVWDAWTGELITSMLEHHGAVKVVAFSPGGTRVVTAGADGAARVWDAWTGKPVTRWLKHQGTITVAAFSPDGMDVVTASSDEAARVWDAWRGLPVTSLAEHQGAVSAVAFSPDGLRVLTASDHTTQMWDIWSGNHPTPLLDHHSPIIAIAFSPDGPRVLTANDDHTAQIRDAATDTLMAGPLDSEDVLPVAAFSHDGTSVITVSSDNMARIWHTSTSVTGARAQEDVIKMLVDPDAITDPADSGSLDDWRRLARCSPFVLVNNVPKPNLDPLRVCPQH